MDSESFLEDFLNHSHDSFHDFQPVEVELIRKALLEWYDANRRKLPWRGDPPPYLTSKVSAGSPSTGSRDRAKRLKKLTPKKTQSKANPQKKQQQLQQQAKISKFFAAPPRKKIRKPGQGGCKVEEEPTVTAEELTDSCSPAGGAAKSAGALVLQDDAISSKAVDDRDTLLPEAAQRRSRVPVSAYETWVSEIMCQQTRVETVIGYFLRWMKRFPTVEALAEASIEDVNSVWAGLGYYRRARMLHEGAQTVCKSPYNGVVPSTLAGLKDVKGIGDYTAGAILSIAYRQPVPVVDGNVLRVLSRLRAICADPADPHFCKKLAWRLAAQLVDPDRPGDFNQALMEYGALICTPSQSDFSALHDPLESVCMAVRLRKLWPARRKRPKERRHSSLSACPACSARFGDVVSALDSGVGTSASPLSLASLFPLKKIKKPKRCEEFAVCVLTRGSSEDKQGLEYFMIRRGSGGEAANTGEETSKASGRKKAGAKKPVSAAAGDGKLLHGQWDFPNLPIVRVSGGSPSSSKSKLEDSAFESTTAELYADLRVNVSSLSSRRKKVDTANRLVVAKPVVHVFSHVKYTLRLNCTHLPKSANGPLGGGDGRRPRVQMRGALAHSTAKWMSLDEMQRVGITVLVKKMLKAAAETSKPTKRKPSLTKPKRKLR